MANEKQLNQFSDHIMSQGSSIEADASDALVFFPYFYELLYALHDLPKILLPAGCINEAAMISISSVFTTLLRW